MTAAAIALNRFGLGARANEAVPADPQRWLLDQLARYEPRPAAWAALPQTDAIARDYQQFQAEQRAARAAARQPGDPTPAVAPPMTTPMTTPTPMPALSAGAMDAATATPPARVRPAAVRTPAVDALRRDLRDTYRAAVNARAASALATDTPFVERLVHFWANHFAVSADKLAVIPFAGAYEAEAIRPHVLGRFEDLLLAAERHPAMMVYLDQVQSIGPDSPVAQRAALRDPAKKRGLNENLAREIMELHTLGVRSGYGQADVTEFARALTGWSLAGIGAAAVPGAAPGTFLFRPALHEPGARTILGRSYAQPGEAQALAVLHDIAAHPATATHVATKLARHFVADAPPPALVARLAQAFTRSGGDLPTVYRALVEAPESWAAATPKFKTPWEWTISSLRGIGMRELGPQMDMAPLLRQLGQPVWQPGSPAGFDDIAASWAAPDALVRRVELAQRLASRVGDRLDARTLAAKLLPGGVSPATGEAIARAESPPAALALLLVAPRIPEEMIEMASTQAFGRRYFLRVAALGAGAMLVGPRIAFAAAATERRFLFVIQRGAADGLETLIPTADPGYARLRGELAIDPAAALKLDGQFALNPALVEVHKMYLAGEALPVHAVASPYRERSHFDAQNVLETGGTQPYQIKDGWLNRLVGLLPRHGDEAIAFAPTVPLALRGSTEVASYAPSALPAATDDLLARVGQLYAGDAQLHPLWSAAMEARGVAGDVAARQDPAGLGRLAATFLAKPDGPRIAMIETGGWDTHTGQTRRLAQQLKALDTTLGALRDGLGPVWRQTTVLVATEFGRTAAANGTGGTDHGTGSAALLLGGAVKGGRVLADWPGLSPGNLLDGRDLKPTTALDALIAQASAESMALDPGLVGRRLFPQMVAARGLPALLRA